MKIRLNFLYILAAVLMLSVASCKKDQTMVIASSDAATELTASAQTLVLNEENAADQAVTLSWSKPDFGYAAAIDYYLQVSFKDSAFSKISSIGIGTATSISYTVEDLNTLLLGAKYPSDEANDVQIRVLAQVADSLFVYSNVLTVNVTPYLAKRVITYPNLYMPGDYQGWDPTSETIAKLYSINSNTSYKGYINVEADTNYFKITAAPNWDGTNYGTGGKGLLSTTGDNLMIDTAGYYLVTADTKALSWSYTRENWGMIGDAIGGWDDADEVMFDFDKENQVLTKTVNLVAGGLKFRANHDWTLNLGAGAKYGGDNYTITTAGTYLITLDLRVPDEPVVTMTLQ
ncbi:protein of unknown function [Arachidicoccus rhizosphaerae]|uniref:SusE outer membrane protein n=1 Tax=Arachidicoccus rhizosphaerae TaxID=551991 RepID=A0A1H3ZN17_9BACT|nr:SusE domain-containing protein [Arachidicoccus rhizosphaerae]SEA24811.1 protein of unknown function [Arachidicoccus rhizosphaerae]